MIHYGFFSNPSLTKLKTYQYQKCNKEKEPDLMNNFGKFVTVPIPKIISVKNAQAWVSMVS